MDVFCQGIIAPLLPQYRNDCHRKTLEHSHHPAAKINRDLTYLLD